jgi:hypothetical protein
MAPEMIEGTIEFLSFCFQSDIFSLIFHYFDKEKKKYNCNLQILVLFCYIF